MKRSTLTTALLALLAVPAVALGQQSAQGSEGSSEDGVQAPTRVNVHVLARDAKLIGSSVGGARVQIWDVATGEVLAEGLHEGGTGDTQRIMGPIERGEARFGTPGAAVFAAELPLSEPTVIRVGATGPMDYEWARAYAEKTFLVVPGHHLEGDGVTLELPGYIVEVLGVQQARAGGGDVEVTARVRMLCSCPTEPGGTWEAGEVRAELIGPDGDVLAETDMSYQGEDSTYGGTLVAPESGTYELRVTAVSAETGNAGMVRAELRVG